MALGTQQIIYKGHWITEAIYKFNEVCVNEQALIGLTNE